MRKIRHALLIACSALMGCATAIAADESGFKDSFKYISQRRWYVSNGWANGTYQSCEWRADALAASDQGLKLTISDRGGKARPFGCPELHTTERLGYGLYEARMRTAAGAGLNTAFFTYIGPPMGVPEWDEIDFEFLGKAPERVEVNHYAQGKIVRGKIVDLGFDSSKDFHDYAFEWSKLGIKWFVDGKEVYATPNGAPIPRNPGFLFFSLWSGSQEEDAWLGHFDYKGPATAMVAWTAYTPLDAACKFPESLKCKQK